MPSIQAQNKEIRSITHPDPHIEITTHTIHSKDYGLLHCKAEQRKYNRQTKNDQRIWNQNLI